MQSHAYGNHADSTDWKIGDLTIRNCTECKYIGDVISSNGKNKSNLNERKCKITASTLSITSIAASEVLNRIEAADLLELHEKVKKNATRSRTDKVYKRQKR